ncbi:MAG: RuBisCO large subunit C-terminal-like domain-containing protein [Geminicoccaceae bacterium]
MVDALCRGGIDFVKDDELQGDGPHCPFEARARAVMRVIDRHAEATGKRVMYAFNITGDLERCAAATTWSRRSAAPALARRA